MIFRFGFDLFFSAARFAAMDDDECTVFHLKSDRAHHSSTGILPVSGILVNMQRPKANRAMVCVPIAFNERVAVKTGKILFCSDKSLHANEADVSILQAPSLG